jgi:hypothetical protein
VKRKKIDEQPKECSPERPLGNALPLSPPLRRMQLLEETITNYP